jgi:hypothetical protein
MKGREKKCRHEAMHWSAAIIAVTAAVLALYSF